MLLSSVAVLIFTVLAWLWRKRSKQRDWERDTVVITGGCGNIGRALCDELLRRKAKVILLDKQCNHTDYEKYFIRCDMASSESINSVLDSISNVTVLINNCGITNHGKKFEDLSEQDVDNVMNVNFSSYTKTIRRILPQMIESKRSCAIVNMASCLGIAGVPFMTDYCASKFAIYGFNEALRMELKAMGFKHVSIIICCPFFVRNGLFQDIKIRFPWLTPPLTAAHVARNVIDSIETGKEEIWMPWSIHLTPLFRILPTWLFDACQFMLGTQDSLQK